MSWAHAPVAGRRACRGSSPIAGHIRMTRPRSAVTVWSSAPAAHRSLTGFSRSGRSSSLGWLAVSGEVLVRSCGEPSLRLTAEGGHTVDNRGTFYACNKERTLRCIGRRDCHTARRPLHVQHLDGCSAAASQFRVSVPVSGRGHLSVLG